MEKERLERLLKDEIDTIKKLLKERKRINELIELSESKMFQLEDKLKEYGDSH